MKRLTVLLASLFLTTLLHAADTWEQVRNPAARDDVKVWVKPVPGQSLKAFKGVIEVPHSMLTALAVLGDIPRFPEWVFQCNDAQPLSDLGHDINYVHISGIWPVADRDAVTRTTLEQDPQTLAITAHTVVANGLYPEKKGTVRLPALDNRFIFEPLPDGWTRITFETFADPGGFIPGWLANLVAVDAPLDTLEGMSELMREDKYQITRYQQLPMSFASLATMQFPSGPSATSAQ